MVIPTKPPVSLGLLTELHFASAVKPGHDNRNQRPRGASFARLELFTKLRCLDQIGQFSRSFVVSLN